MNADERQCDEWGREAAAPRPVPVRYWWLKRIVVGALVWVAVMGAVRFWWGRVADRRLAAEIATYQAAGEPIYPEDFKSEPVPDEENGATIYLSLDGKFYPESQEFRDELRAYLADPSSVDVAQMAEGFRQHALLLAMARDARSKPQYDWGVRMKSPLIHQLLPSLGSMRAMVRLSCGAALYEHGLANDSEAVEHLRDAMAAGAAMDHLDAFLISHLVSCALYRQVASSVEYVSPGLRIVEDGEPPEKEARSAQRDAVEALLADLLDEESFRMGSIRAMHGERAASFDTYRMIVEMHMRWGYLMDYRQRNSESIHWPWLERAFIWLIEPLLTSDALRMMQLMSFQVEAAGAANHEEAKRHLTAMTLPTGLAGAIRHPLSSMLMPALGRVVAIHFQGLALRRRAAVGLAARLYEVDHGRWPERVEDLVPAYLEAVPLDPMTDDGSVIDLPMWCEGSHGVTKQKK